MGNRPVCLLLAVLSSASLGCNADSWVVVPSQDAADAAADAAWDDVGEDVAEVAPLDAPADEAAPLDVRSDDAILHTVADSSPDAPAVDAPVDAPAEAALCPAGQSRCGGECVARPANFYGGEGNAEDSVGAQHGVVFNGVRYAAGRFGRAFAFGGPGTSQYVEIPTSVASFGTGDFTIEFWVNSIRGGNVFSKRNQCWGGDVRGGFDVIMDTGRVGSELWASGYYHLLSITELSYSLMDGNWHHVAVMRRDATARLYVDGAVLAERPLAGDINEPALTPIYLGVGRCVAGAPGSNGNANSNQWFAGMLDEVGFYPRAMPERELTERSQGRCRF